MKKAWKIIKKTLLWGSFVFLFLVTVITVLLKIYEKDIKKYAVEEINKYLAVKVDVQDIDIAFLTSFPYASLDFQKIIIKDNYETISSDDTLFYAKNLYLSFSVFDIYNEDYSVKNIEASQAVLKLKTAENGEINYNITKPSKDTSESKFEFAVEVLKLDDLEFEYANMATKQFYVFNLKQAKIKGDFNETEYELSAEAGLYIHQIKTNSFSIITQKNADLDLKLNINTKSKTYNFTKGDFTIEQMPFKIYGEIMDDYIDLAIDGDQIDMDNLSKTILNNSIEVANSYQGEGSVSFKSKIVGELQKTSMPSISASFSIVDGKITHLENNLTITKINVKGRYNNSQPMHQEVLVFDEMKMNLLGSYVEGHTELVDFAVPTFKGEIEGEVDLENVHAFFHLPSIKTLGGKVEFNTTYAIQFKDIQYNPQLFDISETKGQFALMDASYQGLTDNVLYQKINGNVVVNGDDAAAKNISIHTQNSDLLLNGALKGFIPFVEGNNALGLIATLESDYILLNDFLGDNKENANNEAEQTTFEMIDAISLNLDLKVKMLDWDNHQFKNIDGKLLLNNRILKIPRFNLSTLNGDIAGNLKLENYLEKGNTVEGKFRFNGINVTQLFEEWDNFDQTTILSSNLKGNAKGQIDMVLLFDQYFNIDMDKIWVDNKITLTDGALLNLPVMKDITDYMRSNKALKVALSKHIDNFDSKLSNIQFETLQNDILIENGRINIPKMDIKSSAMDITLAGWHDFDDDIDYHFSFRFRELKTIPEYSEFGKVEDDGLGWKIYLSMAGNIDDPSYSLDKDFRNATIKENVTEEKETVKSILKSELGLFKKDTTVKQMQMQEKSKAVEFIMYDEDQDIEELNPKTEKKKKVTGNKKQTNRFFEKLKAAEEKQKAKQAANTLEIER
ncbi:MAG: AsmA-like C-terminal region-containing protein [Crocinitomicaceae bacterium]